jgi:hypothetical protein
MATYKTLDDYCVSWSASALEKVRAMISQDFASGIIDQTNYDELLEDLESEVDEARDMS